MGKGDDKWTVEKGRKRNTAAEKHESHGGQTGTRRRRLQAILSPLTKVAKLIQKTSNIAVAVLTTSLYLEKGEGVTFCFDFIFRGKE